MALAAEVRIVYVGDTTGAAWRGVRLGLQEANILGGYTGHSYVLEPMPVETLLASAPEQRPQAVVAALDNDTLSRLSTPLRALQMAVFNVTADADALRDLCIANLLHIPPSARMKQDALAQWQQKHPGATAQPRAWHETYTKFAARDLNNRFRKLHQVGMDDDAWAGWAALKLLAETVARAQTTTAAGLLTYIRQELAFDGQKGVPQTFRDNGQMRQPLLLVDNAKIVGEAPVAGVTDSNNLDSLGMSTCQR